MIDEPPPKVCPCGAVLAVSGLVIRCLGPGFTVLALGPGWWVRSLLLLLLVIIVWQEDAERIWRSWSTEVSVPHGECFLGLGSAQHTPALCSTHCSSVAVLVPQGGPGACNPRPTWPARAHGLVLGRSCGEAPKTRVVIYCFELVI